MRESDVGAGITAETWHETWQNAKRICLSSGTEKYFCTDCTHENASLTFRNARWQKGLWLLYVVHPLKKADCCANTVFLIFCSQVFSWEKVCFSPLNQDRHETKQTFCFCVFRHGYTDLWSRCVMGLNYRLYVKDGYLYITYWVLDSGFAASHLPFWFPSSCFEPKSDHIWIRPGSPKLSANVS